MMAEDYTAHAMKYLQDNPGWLTDARNNAPLLQPMLCALYMSRRFDEPYKQMAQAVYRALAKLGEER